MGISNKVFLNGYFKQQQLKRRGKAHLLFAGKRVLISEAAKLSCRQCFEWVLFFGGQFNFSN